MFHFGSITLWYVIIGTVLATISASCVGTLTLLQKRPLAGDAVSHALLPGLCVGFMLAGQKSLPALLTGAFVTGLLAFWLIDIIPQRSKVKEDTATALVLSLAIWPTTRHMNLRASGSMPADGSSSMTKAGLPTSAMASDSLRLLPPL